MGENGELGLIFFMKFYKSSYRDNRIQMASFMNIYCPDCRGTFDIDFDEISEKDVLECDLCMAEIEVLQLEPLRLKVFLEE